MQIYKIQIVGLISNVLDMTVWPHKAQHNYHLAFDRKRPLVFDDHWSRLSRSILRMGLHGE